MYKVLLHFSDGTSEYDDEVFESKEEAGEYGLYLIGCTDAGYEILNRSNPEEYPMEEYRSPEYELVEST